MGTEGSKVRTFTDLLAWQKSHALCIKIYTITKNFPSDERFGLTSQIQRASVSVTSNIAEGFGRNSSQDKNRFYTIAKGSLLETQSQLILAKDLGYIDIQKFDILTSDLDECIRIIAGLMKSSADRNTYT